MRYVGTPYETSYHIFVRHPMSNGLTCGDLEFFENSYKRVSELLEQYIVNDRYDTYMFTFFLHDRYGFFDIFCFSHIGLSEYDDFLFLGKLRRVSRKLITYRLICPE